jgi:ribonuclease HII
MFHQHEILTPEGGLIAGVDEAGRGPLAGPVVAAAVILGRQGSISGLADSKTLSEARRNVLAGQIREFACAWSIGLATVEEIDRLNILKATMLAMQRAIEALAQTPSLAMVDGNQKPPVSCPVQTVVRGDALVPCISAASILAKVTRDALMRELDAHYPQYGFAVHKGYPTAVHLQALAQYGVSPVHRRSFGPVRRLLDK